MTAYRQAPMQPCGRRLSACIDDVCRSMGECAWPPPVRKAYPPGPACSICGSVTELRGERGTPYCRACRTFPRGSRGLPGLRKGGTEGSGT